MDSYSDEVMAKCIVVDGLPGNVTPEKREPFLRLFKKKVSEKLGHENYLVHLVIDDNTALVIGAFLAFARVQEADKALALLNKFAFTKTDVFETFRWSSFKAVQDSAAETEYVPPVIDAESVANDLINTMMEDELARPELLVKSGTSYDVEWYRFDVTGGKLDLYRKPSAVKDDSLGQWSELDRKSKRLQNGMIHGINTTDKPMPIWSPYGTMVISQHTEGLKFWGGKTMAHMFSVESLNVKAFQISANEKFLLLKTDKDFSVWNIHESKLLRTLAGFDLDRWPIGKFSADDAFTALVEPAKLIAQGKQAEPGKLFLYTTETMRLVAGSEDPRRFTLELDGLHDFEWSPTNGSQIALVFADVETHQGWKVSVEHVDAADNFLTLGNLCRRNFLDSVDIKLLWHSDGSHLAVKNTTRKGDVEYCLFKVGLSLVTADYFKVEKNLVPVRFAWHPGGPNFAVILEDKLNTTATGGAKQLIKFYSMDKAAVKLIGAHPTIATSLLWAPRGNRLVAANYDKSSLEFYAINERAQAVFLERKEHPAVNSTQWDPSGRFYASWTSSINQQMDNRYRIFDMNGRLILESKAEKLSHLAWRPLAKQLLTHDEIARVKRELSSYSERYEREDRQKEESKVNESNRKKQEKEKRFIKVASEIEEYHTRRGVHERHPTESLDEVRAQLRANAPAARRQRQLLADLPEKTIRETITEERIQDHRVKPSAVKGEDSAVAGSDEQEAPTE